MKTAPSPSLNAFRLCPKGGKAQIIGPEEEDEENDGYPFNEVRKLKVLFLFCILPFPPSAQYFSSFFVFGSDGRPLPGHRVVEVAAGTHDRVHEIRLHAAFGPQPSGSIPFCSLTAVDTFCCCVRTFITMRVCFSCSTCRWRPTWAPARKTPAHSRLRSAPISWTRMLYVFNYRQFARGTH